MDSKDKALLAEAVDILERINHAFYVDGTRKKLKPVMAETKPMIARLRESLNSAAHDLAPER